MLNLIHLSDEDILNESKREAAMHSQKRQFRRLQQDELTPVFRWTPPIHLPGISPTGNDACPVLRTSCYWNASVASWIYPDRGRMVFWGNHSWYVPILETD